jgi:hypothetical protein
MSKGAEQETNIYFIAVARVQGEGIVLAHLSNNCEVELSGVCQVIEQPTMQIEPGKHYSFSVGDFQTWHLIGGKCTPDYIRLFHTKEI